MIDKILNLVKPKRKVLILTHNNPDPDTLGSAVGIKNILTKKLQKRCTIAYDGIIGRAENREMVKQCKIDIHNSRKLNFSRYDCIILMDTQPTAGNVYIQNNFFPHIVVDHHNFRTQTEKANIYDVRPDYGSTSTIIGEYYKALNLELDKYTATALYYGIKTDTIGYGRSNSKVDLEMMGYILPFINLNKLAKIETPDLPRYHFKNIKKAIENSVVIDNLIFCNLEEVRNTDLIAETADILLRIRDIKWTFVIGSIDNMAYFSLRCKSGRKKVGSIALSIARKLGTGGGHMKSAGGQIPLNQQHNYEEICTILKRRLLLKIGIKDTEEKPI
jgi:nanoRNase/pAp phosphatase (c-di-AMP/oligoRNAs hydrolase)